MTRFVRAAVAVTLAVLLTGVANPALAQQGQPGQTAQQATLDYSQGRSHLPNIFGPYMPMRVPEPVLTNSPRIETMITDGKLQVSLQDAIALALENNLDISVQRYLPWLAETDLLRAKAGLGTPAGRFDPLLTSVFNWDRRSFPVNNPFLSGTGVTQTAITNQSTQVSFNYQQGFHTGTSYFASLNNTRSSSGSAANLLNPSIQSTLTVGISQPLLNGFGLLVNTRGIKIASNNRRTADLTFAEQVIITVSTVQNLYWDLVFAREDVKVKTNSVELAARLLRDNQRQVEIGTLAPIEVVRAEAEVARTGQDLIVAQTFLLQMQTLMKNAITKSPLDPTVRDLEIVPTDVITKPPSIDIKSLEDDVAAAYENRPDIRRTRIDLESRGIDVRAARNALLPTLNVSGQWGATGLAGNSRVSSSTFTGFQANQNAPLVDANGNPVLIGGMPVFAASPVFSTTSTFLRDGLTGALGTVFDAEFPSYSFRFDLQFPIRNRAAQADSARALLTQRQTETTYRRLENAIVVEVRNAQISLQQSQARVAAAQKSRELAERTLDAEQKKYQLGASTIFFVIQAQRDLAQAQSAEVRSLSDLLKARVEYDRALGRTLDVNQIDVGSVKTGSVRRVPLIPGTVNGEIINVRSDY